VSDAIQALLEQAIAAARAAKPERIPLIGVSGAQGAGKTYQCRRYVSSHPRVAHFSLDDVYLTHAERTALAQRVHPLFATRGPPGTHDLALADRTITALRAAAPSTQTPLPRFDKAADDRAPERAWPIFNGRPDAILFDGWCVGALPDALGEAPLNALEAQEDADGRWRAHIRAELASTYALFFARFDAVVYLKPPSWEIVTRWRAEQEEENLSRALASADYARLDHFLMHYERITRSMMAGGHTARATVSLNGARQVS
jgi:D-glycerate 3-kinase